MYKIKRKDHEFYLPPEVQCVMFQMNTLLMFGFFVYFYYMFYVKVLFMISIVSILLITPAIL